MPVSGGTRRGGRRRFFASLIATKTAAVVAGTHNYRIMTFAYTICSANYLPYAKTLADSVVQHNRDTRFVIALLDTHTAFDRTFFAPHLIVPVPEMGLPGLATLNQAYDIFELSCALKPFVAEYILQNNEAANTLFYFDSDILVVASLEKAAVVLRQHPLVLTPHRASLPPGRQQEAEELSVLRTGLYNAGFFGISRSEEAFRFLNWWKERMKYYCRNDAAHGLFVDQLWLNLAPLYIRNSVVLYDPGYNVAYWNFPERTPTVSNGQVLINERWPLVFFHFSGYDFAEPGILSRHQKEYTLDSHPAFAPLFQNYRELVLQNNPTGFLSLPVTMGKPRKSKRKRWFLALWRRPGKKN